MLNLRELLKESLMTESMNEVALVWSHWTPSEIYCATGNIKMLRKALKDYDYNFVEGRVDTRLACIRWNDEDAVIVHVEGNNYNDAKKRDIKNIQSQLDAQKDSIEKEGFVYIESNIFGGANEWYDMEPDTTAKEYLDMFIELMNNSYVDGDSRRAYALVDLMKGETLAGCDSVIFMTAEELIEHITNVE